MAKEFLRTKSAGSLSWTVPVAASPRRPVSRARTTFSCRRVRPPFSPRFTLLILLSRVAIETQVDWHYELMISSLGKISERRDRLIFCGARAENPDFSQVAVV